MGTGTSAAAFLRGKTCLYPFLRIRLKCCHFIMKKILLVNPPIYDFAAYDFWMKPYGLLNVAGKLQGKAELSLFDYMDREDTSVKSEYDRWGRGKFHELHIDRPPVLSDIKRYYHRFGLERGIFQNHLQSQGQFDFALIQTTMTYWYPGIMEVIEDIKRFQPQCKIVLGGIYTAICPKHAATLGADMVVAGTSLDKLWQFLDIEPDINALPFWKGYEKLRMGVITITQGCPFQCSYCTVPNIYGNFTIKPMKKCLEEIDLLQSLGAENIAFYDDALLYRHKEAIMPLLHSIVARNLKTNFHTPNAMNARFVSYELAELMVASGMKTFYLGFECIDERWQNEHGGKVFSHELIRAVDCLLKAGADNLEITAYQMLGHPDGNLKQLEKTMQFVHELGIRIMLADFSPIPGTPDGDKCSQWTDLSEPLNHNKTAFPIRFIGEDTVNEFKDLARRLNRKLTGCE